MLNQTEAVRLLDAKNGKVPAYGYPRRRRGALARAARYGEWRSAPQRRSRLQRRGRRRGPRRDPRVPRARARRRLAAAADVTALLRLYGIPLVVGNGSPP